ncbi:MAG TPA: LysM domain-containing protein [Polyangia bacterium]|jgi:LysM repeat protein
MRTRARTTLLFALAVTPPLGLRGAVVSAQPADDDASGAATVDGRGDDDPDETVPAVTPAASSKTGGARSPTYTIRAGDTLSTVSQEFLRDPMSWPKLWALNPEIPNPHWIYPGQVVRLRDGSAPQKVTTVVDRTLAANPPQDELRPRREAPRPSLVTARVLSHPTAGRPEAPRLRQLGFVDEGALKAAGTINGSLEEKLLLATGDQAYVEFPAGHAPKVAGRYSVYQVDTTRPVKEPGSKVVMGYLVHVCGEVAVDGVSGDRTISNGRLVDLAEPVERGYRVGPLLPDMRTIAPRPNAVSVTARIIAALDPGSLIASQTFVVLNRGRRHGVETGNRFLILRQGDGLKRVLESWDTSDPRFPPHAIAEILAVDVQNETTVGWISRGTAELRLGDVADLQRGY